MAEDVIASLQRELAAEKQKNESAHAELDNLRRRNTQMAALAEQEEEMISNKLMKRLTELKREKEKLVLQVEQEEELLTNQLQFKLEKVRKEKVELENQLEHEQEYIVNRLQKQLTAVTAEKMKLEVKLNDEHCKMVDTLDASLKQLASSGTHDEQSVIGSMANEIKSLRQQQEAFAKERTDYRARNSELLEDLTTLKNTNDKLRNTLEKEQLKYKEMAESKVELEATREMDLECLYNLGAHMKTVDHRAASPRERVLAYVHDRSIRDRSSSCTSCTSDDDSMLHSASPGSRSRTSSRASSSHKHRPTHLHAVRRTPSPPVARARGTVPGPSGRSQAVGKGKGAR